MRWPCGIAAAAGALAPLAWPAIRADCTNPLDVACPLDVALYQALALICAPLWQVNRGALVLARWVEDLGQWLIDGLFVSGADALTKPISAMVLLALALAVLLGAITFFLQALLTLHWVDLQRALPTLALAALLLLIGGAPLRVLDHMQQIGAALLQETVMAAVTLATAPPIPSAPQDELGDVATSIYAAPIVCGGITLAPRVPATLALNDFAARYVWADGADIHCADPQALPGAFRAQYLAQDDISGLDRAGRWRAIGLAAQGVVRLGSGLPLSGGAIADRSVAQLFRLALGLVFLTLLIALPFGLFVPTDALVRQQLTALIAIVRGAWVAGLVLGVGLALLLVVARSGNPWLLWLAGQAFGLVGLWQGWQALRALGTALGAANALAGNVPGAVGRAAGSWGTTAALLAATAASGGGGALLGVLGRAGVGRLGQAAGRMGGTRVAQLAGGQLARRAQARLDDTLGDAQLAQAAQQAAAEAAWYARTYDLEADPGAAQAAQAATARAAQATAQRRARQIARARQAGDFATADRPRRQPPAAAPPAPAGAAPPPTAPAAPPIPPAPVGMGDAPWAQAVQAAADGNAPELARLLTVAQTAQADATTNDQWAAATAQTAALEDLLVQAQRRLAQRAVEPARLAAALRPRPQPFTPGQPVTATRRDGVLYLNGVAAGAIDRPLHGHYAAHTARGPVPLTGLGANLLATLPDGGVVTVPLPDAPAAPPVPAAGAAPTAAPPPWKRGGP